MQKRIARERDQPHGVAVQLRHEVGDRELGARKSIGFHIGGQHAARCVDGENDVVTAARDLFPTIAGLRTCQGDEHQGKCPQQQAALDAASCRRDRQRQLRAQVGRDELDQRCLLLRVITPPHPKQREAGRYAGR